MHLQAEVSEKQAEYIYATEPTVVYVGGVGAGKTIANTLLVLRYAEQFPGIRVLMCAPTYQMLHDTTMHEFFASVPRALLTSFRGGSYPEAIVDFGRGPSQILFRAFDDAHKPRSLNLGLAVIDEGISARFDVILSIAERLRVPDMPNHLRMTSNSGSRESDFFKTFVANPNPDRKVISCTSFDNPFLPAGYLARLRDLEQSRPLYFRRMVLGEWGEIDDAEIIGAFESDALWDCAYCVAFIDSSFSNKKKTDSTSVSIVGVITRGAEKLFLFTGRNFPKSIADPDTQRGVLTMLERFKPIDTCLESQLSDATEIFFAALKEAEKRYTPNWRNNWTKKHQSAAKHERITSHVAANKYKLRVLDGTDSAYLAEIANYNKFAEHDDAPDSLAGALELWQTSPSVARYIRIMGMAQKALRGA